MAPIAATSGSAIASDHDVGLEALEFTWCLVPPVIAHGGASVGRSLPAVIMQMVWSTDGERTRLWLPSPK